MNRWHSLPAEVYALVENTPATVLLENAKPDNPDTGEEPWTQLFTAPLRVCAAYTAAEIPALFAAIESALAAGQCAAGFFSYECGAYFEPKAGMRPVRDGQPLAWIGIYERAYAFDHDKGRFVDGEPPALEGLRGGKEPAVEAGVEAQFARTEAEYAQRIAAIHEWIRAGDVYQLNFTVPLRVKAPGSSSALYAQLRTRQPVEFGAFVHWQQGRHILSFSPELFFRVEDDGVRRRITTRPMKGTAAAPREKTARSRSGCATIPKTAAKT